MRKVLIPGVLATLIASGCAATASGGVHGDGHHRARAAGPACPKLAAIRRPRPGGVLLGVGQVGARTLVPWAKVGRGWILAEYSASVAPESSAKPRLGPVSLYLIDPAGGRYLMYRWAAHKEQGLPELIDWSPDASRALIVPPQNAAGNTPTRVLQLTLATGRVTAFDVPENIYPQAYAEPGGQAMLATSGDQKGKLIRYCLTGRRGPVLANTEDLGFAQSDSGIVAVSWTRGISLVDAMGRVIRRLPVPGIRAAGGCGPSRWWNTRTVLAVCQGHGLWLVPADGSAPRHLTPARNGDGADPFGDTGAWALPSGLYLQALGACSALFIVKQLPTGQVKAVNISGTTGNNNRIIGSLGTRLLVRAQTGCPGSDSLLWLDPATRAVQMLLPAPRDVIGVLAAIPRVS